MGQTSVAAVAVIALVVVNVASGKKSTQVYINNFPCKNIFMQIFGSSL